MTKLRRSARLNSGLGVRPSAFGVLLLRKLHVFRRDTRYPADAPFVPRPLLHRRERESIWHATRAILARRHRENPSRPTGRWCRKRELARSLRFRLTLSWLVRAKFRGKE